MEVLEAIETRRSVGKVRPERPPRELVERLLDAATHAPNHYLTQPWRFFVVAGRTRAELGEVMAASLRARLADPDSPEARAQLEREAAKPLRAPVVVAVVVEPASDPRAVPVEDLEAGAAAVENLLLAAHGLGLGAQWRTGEAAYDPAVKRFFGLPPEAPIVGFVYLGYPAADGRPTTRRSAAEKTTWLGWE